MLLSHRSGSTCQLSCFQFSSYFKKIHTTIKKSKRKLTPRQKDFSWSECAQCTVARFWSCNNLILMWSVFSAGRFWRCCWFSNLDFKTRHEVTKHVKIALEQIIVTCVSTLVKMAMALMAGQRIPCTTLQTIHDVARQDSCGPRVRLKTGQGTRKQKSRHHTAERISCFVFEFSLLALDTTRACDLTIYLDESIWPSN